jgi:DNA (cytosine-5)-methyltransferase 1
LVAVDLFCGAGGTSTGLYRACHATGKRVDLLAVNHWPRAIATHRANYPGARHICDRLESIRPEDAIPGGKVDILAASPECTHHSLARGGKPTTDQQRSSAWLILRWLETLKVDNLLIENVREFRDWGPVGANGKPLKSKKGETYRAWLNAVRSFGYTVEDRLLNAADFGDPTTRQRLFILARKGKRPIRWPDPTHGSPDNLYGLLPYRTAREIIDWTLKGESIFTRKRPLAPATLARIAAGLKKYGGVNAKPFLVMLYGTNNARDIDRPMPTITGGGNHTGLAEPFLIKYHGNHKGKTDGEKRVHDIDGPIPTLDTSNRFGLVDPFLIKYYGAGNGVSSTDDPVPTITTKDRFGLVEISGKYQIDIRFRMLQPHELAAAMSFDNYIFTGTKTEKIKQIGNAVPVRIAESLVRAMIGN